MDGFDKGALRVREVEVRPARPDERRRWDDLMREHHYLGFKQFACRGLRHVAEWRGRWVALLGWQSGAFKCAPRDRWLGWHRSVQFRRLHLVANNTRFLVLPEASGIPGLASRSLSRSLRRLSGDWEALHGHPLELAETFVDPARFRGTCYRASNWRAVGRTKGFARHNGSYTDPHGASKEMFVRPLRPDARARLSEPADRPEWACRATPLRYSKAELRSLRGEFARLPDCRRGQGRKHRLETVLSIVALARLSGLSGPVAAAQYGAELDADELRALGAWRSAEGAWTAPSAATICRVMAGVDPDALEAALRAWAAPRLGGDADAALAADGKRIRGANRNVEGAYFETVTLVTHGGRPLASRCCRDEGGELAAMRALFEDVDLSGRVLTLDALHACRDTARAIVETHGADYVLSIKENCPDAFAQLAAVDWDGRDVRRHADAAGKAAHGRVEARRIAARDLLPDTLAPFPEARQAFRVVRERTDAKTGETSTETAYGITSVPAERAGPERLLAWNRGHWQVENANHHRRDASMGEDAARFRARHSPTNHATLNNIVLAVVLHNGFRYLPEASRHYMMHRDDAFEAVHSTG